MHGVISIKSKSYFIEINQSLNTPPLTSLPYATDFLTGMPASVDGC
jgi:hypothetical protein